MEVLSGSVDRRKTPFDTAHNNATHFIVSMSSCAAYESLAERITLLNSMLSLPIIASSSLGSLSQLDNSTKEMYESEMKELETVIKIYCTLPGTPEA